MVNHNQKLGRWWAGLFMGQIPKFNHMRVKIKLKSSLSFESMYNWCKWILKFKTYSLNLMKLDDENEVLKNSIAKTKASQIVSCNSLQIW